MRWFLLVVLLCLAAPASAAPRSVAGLPADKARLNVAAVQHQQTLVESERDGTTLRVGLVMVDHGGSTDVSPQASLYLTMFNEAEMANAASLHLVTHLNELVSAKRTAPGEYVVVVKRYGAAGDEFGAPATVQITIDARQASVDVRQMKGVGEFEFGQITTPITVTEAAAP